MCCIERIGQQFFLQSGRIFFLLMRKRLRHNRWSRHIPTQDSIRAYAFLKPISHFLDHHALWQFNRRSVAGGLAVGLFFSMITPFAQIPLAAVAAIFFRVNLPLAVFGTLLSNPFTTPAILYFAYKLGARLIGHDIPERATVPDAEAEIAAVGNMGAGVLEWLSQSMDWLLSAGWPLVVGLTVLSIAAAIIGYIGVNVIWRTVSALRWRTRCAQRRQPVKNG